MLVGWLVGYGSRWGNGGERRRWNKTEAGEKKEDEERLTKRRRSRNTMKKVGIRRLVNKQETKEEREI